MIYPSYPMSTNTVSGLGNSFTVSVPPYTMVDLLLSPAGPTRRRCWRRLAIRP